MAGSSRTLSLAVAAAFWTGSAGAEIRLGFERFSGPGEPRQGEMAQVMTEMVLHETGAAMVDATCPIRMIETLRRQDLLKELAVQKSDLVDPASRVTPGLLEPTVMVRGHVVEDGTVMSWRVEAVQLDTGEVLARLEGKAPGTTWPEVSEAIGKSLIRDLCAKQPKRAYHFSCGGADPIEQDVCDIGQPFVLNGQLFGHELSGGLSGTTKIVRTPSALGVKWSGSGTYTISLPEGEGQPGSMIVNAGGTTTAGTQSRRTTGQERCVLTPLTDCN